MAGKLFNGFVFLLLFAVCTGILIYGSSLYYLNEMLDHRVERFEAVPEDYDLITKTVSLTSSDGVALNAWFIPSQDEKSKGIILLLHGMEGMDASSLLGQASILNNAGYAVLLPDMRAHGRSGGDHLGLAFEEPRDAAACLDWIRNQPDLSDEPLAVMGVSMGGAVAIRSAAQHPEVDAVISVGSFASVDHMIRETMTLMPDLPDPLADLFTPFMRFALFTMYGASPINDSPLHDIHTIAPRPVLIIHGTADDQILLSNAEYLLDAGGDGVESWFVEGAGHGIVSGDGTGPENIQYQQHILSFLEKNLQP